MAPQNLPTSGDGPDGHDARGAGDVDPIRDNAVGAEDLDEDRMQLDPLEEGMDPPEGWSAADRFGTTAREQQDGETLEQRLWQEQSETGRDDSAAEAGQHPAGSADEAGGSMARAARTEGFDPPGPGAGGSGEPDEVTDVPPETG